MTTYAFIITAFLFTTIGVIAHATFEEWMDSRVRKAREQRKARILKKRKTIRPDLSAETDAAMDEAVALVQNKLGGSILT